MSKVLLLGSTGLLGQALLKELTLRNEDVIGMARSGADANFDISDDNALVPFIKDNNFSVIINACAIVNYQLCEDDKKLAYLVNARPSSILAHVAKEVNAYYVFISTDGYYAGDKDLKHKETDAVMLLNEYARTKYCGEVFTLTNPRSLVARTNIVGFRGDPHEPTFVEWAVTSLKNKTKITLFNDYYTSSISVTQFSKSLCDLMNKKISGRINLASSQVSSKAEFIRKLAQNFGFSLEAAKEGPVQALTPRRANSSGLDVSRAEEILGYHLPGLQEVISQLRKEYDELE
ncbi:MAG TPA: sugar nucleotide-binding protein [Patescibacteria group bacterium]|nr:sugar nucleotide-binding protein [Patescibacteria group bacterium]